MSLSLAHNELGDDGAEAISMGLKESKSLKTLDLSGDFFSSVDQIGPRGATALASAIAIMASLTRLDVSYNMLDTEGVVALLKATEGRSGFKLWYFCQRSQAERRRVG